MCLLSMCKDKNFRKTPLKSVVFDNANGGEMLIKCGIGIIDVTEEIILLMLAFKKA